MIIKGLDFTSAPSRKKPITCANCTLVDTRLRIDNVEHLRDFVQFDELLALPGEWMLGCDFPFAQSRKLVENLNWPGTWEAYVAQVSALTKLEFIELLEAYKRNRASGDKEHRRAVDQLASSISPQKLYGVPVGKMFYEGAKRLRLSPADILPFRISGNVRMVAEVYPALVARCIVGKRSYKNDTRSKQTPALLAARREIVKGLRSNLLYGCYGIQLEFSEEQASRWIADHSGDELDAILCAIQAAWAWLQREDNFGIPQSVDILEGWICDPFLQDALR